MESERQARRGPHYAWVIVILCMLTMFVGMGLNTNTFSVYEPYLMQKFDLTNTQNSFINTSRALMIIFGMLSVGRMNRRFGICRVVAFSIFLQGVTRVLFSMASGFYTCCFAAGLSGLTYAWAAAVPVSILIHRWFCDRQGFALGFAMSGSGIASAVWSPAIPFLVEHIGLRKAFLVEALLTVMIGFLVAVFLKAGPEEMGLRPYTNPRGRAERERRKEDAGHCADSTAPLPEETHLTGQHAVLLFYAALLLLAGPCSAEFAHIAVHFANSGFPIYVIALLLSIHGIFLIIGKLFSGSLTDRFGGRTSTWTISLIYIASQIFLCLAGSGNLHFAFLSMILMGFGLPLSTVFPAIWARDLFPPDRFDSLVQRSVFFFAIGNFILEPLPGILADRSGSYLLPFGIFIVFTVVTLLIMEGLYRAKARA